MKTWLIAASAFGGIFASDIIRLSAIILKKNMGTDDMIEYIEREAVIEKNHGGVVYIDDIRKIPSVDVAPVRHGRLERTAKWWQGGSAWKQCSECGILHLGKSNFCSNCGARMDGE